MANASVYNTQASNTPAIVAGDGSTAITILDANPARIGFAIQNVGTTAAKVMLGSSASTSVFHFVLKGGSADNDGLGASFSMTSGAVYDGIVTFFGASTAKLVALEIAP
jgi:hypothetical protein